MTTTAVLSICILIILFITCLIQTARLHVSLGNLKELQNDAKTDLTPPELEKQSVVEVVLVSGVTCTGFGKIYPYNDGALSVIDTSKRITLHIAAGGWLSAQVVPKEPTKLIKGD